MLLEEGLLLNVNLHQQICLGRTIMKLNIIIRNLQKQENERLPAIAFQLKNDCIKGVSLLAYKNMKTNFTIVIIINYIWFICSNQLHWFWCYITSNHFSFLSPLLESQPQFIGFDIGGWLVHGESNFPAMWFVLIVFCCKTDGQGGKTAFHFLCNWSPLLSFLAGTF